MKKPASQCIWVNFPPDTALKNIKSKPIEEMPNILEKTLFKLFPFVIFLNDFVLLTFSQKTPLFLCNSSLFDLPDQMPSVNGSSSSSTFFNFSKISFRALVISFFSITFLKKR